MSTATYYERLSPLDASFLALESGRAHFHVASVAILDAGPLRTADGGIDIDRIRAFIASRLKYVPRYRQRLASTPLGRSPIWVDATTSISSTTSATRASPARGRKPN